MLQVDKLLDVLCHAYLNSDHFDAMFDSSSPEGKVAMKNLMRGQAMGKSYSPPPPYNTLQVQPAGPPPGYPHMAHGYGGAKPKTKY